MHLADMSSVEILIGGVRVGLHVRVFSGHFGSCLLKSVLHPSSMY